MTNHPHRGKRGMARKQWEAAASAASLLYRAMDARTVTETQQALTLAGDRLRAAGLPSLALWADSLACNFAAPLQAVHELQDAVAEAAGKLEAAYLEMLPMSNCDCCGATVPRDQIAVVMAYGIETIACDACRGIKP